MENLEDIKHKVETRINENKKAFQQFEYEDTSLSVSILAEAFIQKNIKERAGKH